MNITHRIISPSGIEIMIGSYAVTICCVELHRIIENNQTAPVEWSRKGVNKTGLDLMDGDYGSITILQYCPGCGKKVQIRKIAQEV